MNYELIMRLIHDLYGQSLQFRAEADRLAEENLKLKTELTSLKDGAKDNAKVQAIKKVSG